MDKPFLPRLIFCGTPDFAVPSLWALHEAGAAIDLVVTQPDRPQGRGRKLAMPAVKRAAISLNLPVYQPQRIGSPEAVSRLRATGADCLVVVAYGQLLPAAVLHLPRLGAVNLHASLLPRYRGPAPINWAIINGDAVTGATTMLMDEGLDTGPILLRRHLAILPEETAGSLHNRLAFTGASLLVDTLAALYQGAVHPTPQDDSQATYAPALKREDGTISWQRDASEICRLIRGLDPWPGAFTWWRGRRLKLFGCTRAENSAATAAPGTVIAAEPAGLVVAAGSGAVKIKSLQLEGRRRLGALEFCRGAALQSGALLGE